MNRSVLIVDNCLHAMGKGAHSVGEDLAARLTGSGWRVRMTSGRNSRILRLFEMTGVAWIHRQDYSTAIVHLFSGAAFRWAEATCWVLRRCGKPYLLALHGGELPRFCKIHEGRARRLLVSAAGILAPSEYLKSQLSKYCPNIRVLPNGLDLNQFRFIHRRAASPTLVWVRAFHSIYNPTLAVQVLHQVYQSHPDVMLTMIGRDKGDGSLQATKNLARELGVETRLRIIAGVDKAEVPGWLERSDIFLNTTNVDNTPLSVLEAMASGLCVVTTRVGGIPYLVEHENNALIVPPSDPHAMAASIRKLLGEPTLVAKLSAGGRQRAQLCDWSAVIPQWASELSAL